MTGKEKPQYYASNTIIVFYHKLFIVVPLTMVRAFITLQSKSTAFLGALLRPDRAEESC